MIDPEKIEDEYGHFLAQIAGAPLKLYEGYTAILQFFVAKMWEVDARGFREGYEKALEDMMKIADEGEYEDIRREVQILMAKK